MLIIKNRKTMIEHRGTPGTAIRAAERIGLRNFTLLRAVPISTHQKSTAGKWYDITPRRMK